MRLERRLDVCYVDETIFCEVATYDVMSTEEWQALHVLPGFGEIVNGIRNFRKLAALHSGVIGSLAR